MPTSPVAQFMQTSYLTQTGTAYPLAIDADIAVAARIVAPFSPYPTSPAGMSVNLAAGALFVAGTLVEVASQAVTIGAAPSSNSRIDRIMIDEVTGVASVVAGTAAASPTPPAISAGSFPVAQVTIAAGATAITATMIADERVPFVGQGSIRANSLKPVQMAFGAWSSVASAATVDLGGQASRNIYITGSTTITSFGTNGPTDNVPFVVGFTDVMTLTNSANLLLPGGSNITTAAGDMAIIVHDGASVWRVIGYFPAATAPGFATPAETIAGTVTNKPANPAGVVAALTAAMAGLGGAVPKAIRDFGASGTYAPTTGTKFIFGILVGGSGGGNTVYATNGGPGGVGFFFAAVSDAQSYPVSVGGGGGAVGSKNSTGGTGGTTSIVINGTTYAAGGGGGAKDGGGNGGGPSGTCLFGQGGAAGGWYLAGGVYGYATSATNGVGGRAIFMEFGT